MDKIKQAIRDAEYKIMRLESWRSELVSELEKHEKMSLTKTDDSTKLAKVIEVDFVTRKKIG